MSRFPLDAGFSPSDQLYDSRLSALNGISELLQLAGGGSFGDGILLVHTQSEMLRAAELISDEFPELGDTVAPIAKDWLGRQYAAQMERGVAQDGLLLLIEPGSGEVFEIDCGLVDLFDRDMLDDPETFLASDLFAEWRRENASIPNRAQCVGFKTPLFLGGDGVVGNLEVTDESVYWSILAQLRSAL